MAYSLTIDNRSGQWWYVADANKYCPPYTVGATFALSGTRVADIRALTPTGQISNPINNETAQAVFSELHLADSPGTALGNQTTLVPQQNNIVYGQGNWSNPGLIFLVGGVAGFKIRVVSFEVNIINRGNGFVTFTFQDNTNIYRQFACKPRNIINIPAINDAGLFETLPGPTQPLRGFVTDPSTVNVSGGQVNFGYIMVPVP